MERKMNNIVRILILALIKQSGVFFAKLEKWSETISERRDYV